MANESVRYDDTSRYRYIGKTTNYSFNPSVFDQDNRPIKKVTPSTQGNSKLKRILDILGAGSGMLLLLPLFVAIAVAIKVTSRGPVIFRQERYGLDGKLFTIFKFRTMHQHLGDGSGVTQTVSNDPRVTAVGSFLRRSNFDELPQLMNVLRGDMSLVGPRPHVPGMLAAGIDYEKFDTRYMERHQVRPGITGLAQVNGFRGETTDAFSAKMRLEYDLQYLESQSLLLDFKVIAQTIAREFFSGNGY
ncbi:sugar transferase [Labrenzia sp. DG1229]|uniref:sugar transferase n=1 Tax=Labrenzia sp. DG1229 TaxID=681847 RepID=UPI00256FD1C7|nr:sugar transferase [Labrenzia sp. DG1229]